ncbi:MAG: SCP2 sterol-binding domain-containing protein [Deferribacterales bacterium]
MEDIFKQMVANYYGNDLNAVFYLSLDDTIKKTVVVSNGKLEIGDGKPEKADCVVKMSSELLKKIWYENYMPGIKEIFNGSLKVSNPDLLSKLFKNMKKG